MVNQNILDKVPRVRDKCPYSTTPARLKVRREMMKEESGVNKLKTAGSVD